MYVLNVSSGPDVCCKCLAKVDLDVAYIYMHVASICLKCFQVFHAYVFQVLYLDVAYVCIGFQMFLRHFRKCFRRLFQVFHLSFLYIATIASRCFKSRLGVAHGMRVGSGWWCGRSLE